MNDKQDNSQIKTEQQTLDIREFELYHVEKEETEKNFGWAIRTQDGGFVFGGGNKNMSEEELNKWKAYLDYWCKHLNIAFMCGYVFRDGYNKIDFTKASKKEFDRLYEAVFGPLNKE